MPLSQRRQKSTSTGCIKHRIENVINFLYKKKGNKRKGGVKNENSSLIRGGVGVLLVVILFVIHGSNKVHDNARRNAAVNKDMSSEKTFANFNTAEKIQRQQQQQQQQTPVEKDQQTNHRHQYSLSTHSLFVATSQWQPVHNFPEILSANSPQMFVWAPPVDAPSNSTNRRFTKASSKKEPQESQVLLQGTIDEYYNATQKSWFQSFHELSNYEIVCWFGNRTAQMHYETFLSVRQDLFPRQRPFKFHFHPIARLSQPDELWDDELKRKFRKCKQSLVVLENDVEVPEPFQHHLVTFLKHLTVALPDSTFPIWVFTSTSFGNDTDKAVAAKRNQAIYDMLRSKDDLFSAPERIKVLDNTDLTPTTILHTGIRALDIVGVIALRTYVILGKQVQEWRVKGQRGEVDGLHRGNAIEPHPVEDNYKWNILV